MSDDDDRDPAQAEQARGVPVEDAGVVRSDASAEARGGPFHVELQRDAVSEIIAETVVVRQGAVQRIDANDVEIKQAGVLFARAETLDITQAGVMGALAGEVNLELSAARFVGRARASGWSSPRRSSRSATTSRSRRTRRWACSSPERSTATSDRSSTGGPRRFSGRWRASSTRRSGSCSVREADDGGPAQIAGCRSKGWEHPVDSARQRATMLPARSCVTSW